MNGIEFLEYLHTIFVNGINAAIPINFGRRQYYFVQWMANGNFQFEGTQRKSIPSRILMEIKDAYNLNQNLNVLTWCNEMHFNPGGCTITVIKNLLAEFE